jgi:hypothetical protein
LDQVFIFGGATQQIIVTCHQHSLQPNVGSR